jgi:hypothetical protein
MLFSPLLLGEGPGEGLLLGFLRGSTMHAQLVLLVVTSGVMLLPSVQIPAPPPDLNKRTVARILKENPRDEDAIKELYRVGLARKPTDRELKQLVTFVLQMKGAREKVYDDITWVITNSKEYQKRHPVRVKPVKPQ